MWSELLILIYLCINFFLTGVAHEHRLKYSSDFSPVDRLFLYLLIILFGGVLELVNFLRFNNKNVSLWLDLNLFRKYDNLDPEKIRNIKGYLENDHTSEKDKKQLRRILKHIENELN